MTQENFKVMEWLREIRDKSSEENINKPWEHLHKETQEGAAEMTKRIEERRKQRQQQNQ